MFQTGNTCSKFFKEIKINTMYTIRCLLNLMTIPNFFFEILNKDTRKDIIETLIVKLG